MKRFAWLSVVFGLIANLIFVAAPAAHAVKCPDPNKDGKTIGKVVVGKIVSNVKYIDYQAGGVVDPPDSPLNVGLSIRHMPLSSPIGSSLLVWHVNYKGCVGKLDVLIDKKPGFKFSIVDEKGYKQEFKIAEKVQVRKGKYKAEWFQLNGPRQLTMVTCIGKVVNRHYQDNLVILAVPVDGIDYTASPTPTVNSTPTPTPSPAQTISPNPSTSPSVSASPSASK